MPPQTWSVSDAKAHLSEILRLARQVGPQQIGLKQPCMVIPVDEWENLTGNRSKFGPWLVSNFSGTGELEIPPREDSQRSVPFGDDM
jgi:hypothetical protein